MNCESSTMFTNGATIKIKKPTKKSVKIVNAEPIHVQEVDNNSNNNNDITDLLKTVIDKEIKSASDGGFDHDSKHILSHLGEYLEEPYTIIESYFGSQYLERLVRHQI